jgi:hypothetical protein
MVAYFYDFNNHIDSSVMAMITTQRKRQKKDKGDWE